MTTLQTRPVLSSEVSSSALAVTQTPTEAPIEAPTQLPVRTVTRPGRAPQERLNLRDWLRDQGVWKKGITAVIERMTGNCPSQVETQITHLREWLRVN